MYDLHGTISGYSVIVGCDVWLCLRDEVVVMWCASVMWCDVLVWCGVLVWWWGDVLVWWWCDVLVWWWGDVLLWWWGDVPVWWWCGVPVWWWCGVPVWWWCVVTVLHEEGVLRRMHEGRKLVFDAKEKQGPNISETCFCTLCHLGRDLSLTPWCGGQSKETTQVRVTSLAPSSGLH